jgi:hypothetical protein
MAADKEMQDEPCLARSDILQQLFKSSDLNPESMMVSGTRRLRCATPFLVTDDFEL